MKRDIKEAIEEAAKQVKESGFAPSHFWLEGKEYIMDRFTADKKLNINGTHLITYLTTSYEKLVRAFGPPNGKGDDYKVSTEWLIRDTKTDQIITIYDYKETDLYEQGYGSVSSFRARPEYDWHIGSHNLVDIEALSKYIKSKQQG